MKKASAVPKVTRSAKAPVRGRRKQPEELRQAKEALYREHILDVSEQMFAEQGFANTKMQDIARDAGISLGTLYQSYPGKQELYRALLIQRDTEMFQVATERAMKVLPGLSSIEQLLWTMQGHIQFLLEHPDYLRMQLQQGYVWYHSASWPSQDEQQMWERGLSMIEQVFRWGEQEKIFVPGKPAEQAKLMMAMQQARLASWVSEGMQASHAAIVTQIQADFVRLFCRPGVSQGLLSEDGSTLSEPTLSRMGALA